MFIAQLLDWEELPEHAVQLAVAMAARDLVRQTIGDPTSIQATEIEWQRSRQRFEQVEGQNDNVNIFDNHDLQYSRFDPRAFRGYTVFGW